MLLHQFTREKGDLIVDGKIIYPADMDKMMIPICNAFNKIPGLQTAWCCQGHWPTSKDIPDPWKHFAPYISFYVDDIKAVNFLTQVEYAVRFQLARIPEYGFGAITHRYGWHLYMSWNKKQCGNERVRIAFELHNHDPKTRNIVLKETIKIIHQLGKELYGI